jgi:hypothetical protein
MSSPTSSRYDLTNKIRRNSANATAHSLRVLEKSQIEGGEHHDNADVRYQPFQESVPEEQQVYTNDNGNHHYSVKHAKHVPCHFKLPFKPTNSRLPVGAFVFQSF